MMRMSEYNKSKILSIITVELCGKRKINDIRINPYCKLPRLKKNLSLFPWGYTYNLLT